MEDLLAKKIILTLLCKQPRGEDRSYLLHLLLFWRSLNRIKLVAWLALLIILFFENRWRFEKQTIFQKMLKGGSMDDKHTAEDFHGTRAF